MLPNGITNTEAGRRFQAWGDKPRLRFLQALRQAGHHFSQKALAEAVEMSQANSGRYLPFQANTGLVLREPQGNTARFSSLSPLVIEVCRMGLPHMNCNGRP